MSSIRRTMSRRVQLLRFGLRLMNKRRKPRRISILTVRRRLRLIEAVVPGPPAGTQTTAIDAGGVGAVRIEVRQSLSDFYVLYFHGGGYAVGTAQLYRDFTWRIGDAARTRVLFFDYRLAPEHPFPAAVEDAVAVYRWLAGGIDPRRIAGRWPRAGDAIQVTRRRNGSTEGRCAALALDRSRFDRTISVVERNVGSDDEPGEPSRHCQRLPCRRRSAQSLCVATFWRSVWITPNAHPCRERRDLAGRRGAYGGENEDRGMRCSNRRLAAHAACLASLRTHRARRPACHRSNRYVLTKTTLNG
jgi:hypothetical protein